MMMLKVMKRTSASECARHETEHEVVRRDYMDIAKSPPIAITTAVHLEDETERPLPPVCPVADPLAEDAVTVTVDPTVAVAAPLRVTLAVSPPATRHFELSPDPTVRRSELPPSPRPFVTPFIPATSIIFFPAGTSTVQSYDVVELIGIANVGPSGTTPHTLGDDDTELLSLSHDIARGEH